MITAKELDNETSYTHFGARYYDSELIGWLSVDPNGPVISKTYNFFDHLSSANGISSSNTLQISNNKMTGHYLGGTASSISYTVTTVRRNRE